jgi:hypothetical protein
VLVGWGRWGWCGAGVLGVWVEWVDGVGVLSGCVGSWVGWMFLVGVWVGVGWVYGWVCSVGGGVSPVFTVSILPACFDG